MWEPPRLRTVGGAEEERRATWLELFFDLVFVAAIAELSHSLSDNVSLGGFLGFVALFMPIWWCWVGSTFYSTRFDTDDIGHRLLTLVQIAIVVALAVNTHYGLSKTSVSFALSYVAFRIVLILQYLSAGHFIPIARPMTNRYALGFGLGASLWLVSVFVPPPWRFGLWVLGLVVDFSTPLVMSRLITQIPPSASHIPERLGLFIIIVLGESILAVVRGLPDLDWNASSITVGLLGLAIAFSLWWLYFDTVDGSPLRGASLGKPLLGLTWLYAHLPLAIGVAATGVGVEHLVKSLGKGLPDSDRWLLCGSVGLGLTALAGIHWITCTLGARRRKVLAAYRLGSAAFVALLAIGGGNLAPIPLIALVAGACGIQVVLDLAGQRRGAEAIADPDHLKGYSKD